MNKPTIFSRLFYFLTSIFILSGLLILSGCTSIRPETNPLLDKKAFSLAHLARSSNLQIISSKGTGWARLETKEKIDKFRIAWAAVFPNKIRITFLISGHPVETIISTGQKVTFFSHTGEHAKYSVYSTDPNMENYINVPIKMSEMISILLGRFLVKKFDDAYFSPSDDSLSTITLKQKWNGQTQILHLDSKRLIDGIKSMDNTQKCLYKITILKYKTYDFGNIPIKIQITDTKKRKLILDITNFIANPPIKDAVFVLTESR
ncbi:MAG: hypothetical protein GY699_18840 [Desulfobacteraceae bacterium]|nr:hypothetical protein [Desulfobacteraceae bacterium]